MNKIKVQLTDFSLELTRDQAVDMSQKLIEALADYPSSKDIINILISDADLTSDVNVHINEIMESMEK